VALEKWGLLCAEEFSNQVEAEEQLHLPQTPFMTGLKEEKQFVKLQVSIIESRLCRFIIHVF
jgi:hypothetical protein